MGKFAQIEGNIVTQVIETNMTVQQYLAANPGGVFAEIDATPGDAYVGGVVYPRPEGDWEFNSATRQWEDPRTLEDFKAEKWAEIKAARAAHEFGGFEWGGSTFDSDQLSQARITGAALAAAMNPQATFEWTLKDNTSRVLSAAEFTAMATAMLVFVETQHATSRYLRELIEAITVDTPENRQALVAIQWPT